MTRYLVCSLAMIAFITGAHRAIHWAQGVLDFWDFMTMCAVGCALIVALAFGWDRYEHNRSQESQRLAQRDHRQPGP